MSSMFDVVCIGSAKIDEFLTIHDAASHIKLDEKTNELCIKAGEKIIVNSCQFLLGGNACNVAVGLSRLGINSSIMVELGDDEFYTKIINLLSKENVNFDLVKQTKGQPSSFSTIINFKGERTIFSEHVEREHNFSFDDLETKWIYLTSLGNKWTDTYQKTLDFVRNENIKLAFNPGGLQLEDKEKIRYVLEISDILFVNKQEAEGITNSKNATKELLSSLKNLGPKIIVITDGENGSYLLDENGNYLNQETVKTNVIERTGAGDAYASGFLGAVILGLDLKTAMLWGARNSSSVIKKIGAQPGLLKKPGIENYV